MFFFEFFETCKRLEYLKDLAESARYHQDNLSASLWDEIEELEQAIAAAPFKRPR